MVNVGYQTKTPKSSDAAQKLRADHAAARRTAIGLAVKIVEGSKVSDAKVLEARQAADITAADFASLIDTLTDRKAAYDAHHGNKYDAKAQEQKDKIKPALEESQRLEKEAEAAREKFRAANGLYQRCISLTSDYNRKHHDSLRDMTAELGKTGDAHDWKAIR